MSSRLTMKHEQTWLKVFPSELLLTEVRFQAARFCKKSFFQHFNLPNSPEPKIFQLQNEVSEFGYTITASHKWDIVQLHYTHTLFPGPCFSDFSHDALLLHLQRDLAPGNTAYRGERTSCPWTPMMNSGGILAKICLLWIFCQNIKVFCGRTIPFSNGFWLSGCADN